MKTIDYSTDEAAKAQAIFDRNARDVIACNRCPELREYIALVAREKRRAYRNETYWGKPVPAFGDPTARLLIVGLAPGAHGSNRTGRMFTGDASGHWLYRALNRAGFANQPTWERPDDGLQLSDCMITAALRCAPPGNKPKPQQLVNCSVHLAADFALVEPRLRVVVSLGAIAHRAAVKMLESRGWRFATRPVFGHAAEHTATRERRTLHVLCTYHPSQQNTSTKVLTEPMFDAVWERARTLLDAAL
ncbi:uracil-DNA glycosylase [bacterium]|nr:MAG: uracil-DNA glycosylase [bacterium]